MVYKHNHTAVFRTGVSDEVRERGFGEQPPIHEKYADELDDTESFTLKWKVKVNQCSGLQWARVSLRVSERSVSQTPITKIKYEQQENLPTIASEQTAEYFMKFAEQV